MLKHVTNVAYIQ